MCPYCKKEVKRDMRLKVNKSFMSKKGYKSWCEKKQKYSYLKEVFNEKAR